MKHLTLAFLIFAASSTNSWAEEVKKNAEPAPAPQAATNAGEAKKVDAVDISDLEEDYWRPNKDELEVVQNRRFQKAKKFEVAAMYGFYQGADYVNSRAAGVSVAYNITNEWFVDASYLSISATENDLYNSFRTQFGAAPNYSKEQAQEVLSVGWTPIYAKFSLLGKKISHFEMYIAPGIGNTKTTDNHLSKHLTIGQKFFINEHLIFKIDWRVSQYTDKVYSTVGSTTRANGGLGYFEKSETKHNILFGLGWMF